MISAVAMEMDAINRNDHHQPNRRAHDARKARPHEILGAKYRNQQPAG